jgi:hypothetical protein
LFLFDEMGFSIKMRGVCGCVVLFLLCFFFCCFYSCHFLFWWNDIFLVVRAVVLIILDLDSDKKNIFEVFISPCMFDLYLLVFLKCLFYERNMESALCLQRRKS